MIVFGGRPQIYVAVDPIDMRKSFTGLAAATRSILKRDPLSGGLFVFRNRRRTLLKILQWDGTGFRLFAKRLERGTFTWPDSRPGDSHVDLSEEELTALLGGFSLEPTARRKWWGEGA